MTKIILDCDPGHDDALALLLAVASPEIELKAVTTSAGNQTPEKTLNNAMRTLQLLGQTQIPVAGGNQTPLVKELEQQAMFMVNRGWMGLSYRHRHLKFSQ